MLNKKIIGENFSRAAQGYEAVATAQKQTAKKLFRLASPFIFEKFKILDLGAGTGFVAESLRSIFPSPIIFEADLSLEMLSQNRSAYKINCDFENLPFKNNSFDLLISSFSLQWLEDFEHNFAKFSALLKPNGIFVFCVPTDQSLSELKLASVESGCNFHFNILPKNSDLKIALKNSGFEEKLFESEIIKSEFDSALHALKSIKATGANYSAKRKPISKTQLTQFNSFCLKNSNCSSKKFSISWNTSFFIFQKSSKSEPYPL